MADGQVIIEAHVDNSKIDQDVKQSEKQIDSSYKSIGNSADKAGSKVAKVGKAFSVGFAAIGAAAVAVGKEAITGAANLDKAMNQFAASTGIGAAALGDYE